MQGNKKEAFESKLYVGYTEARVVMVNPDNEELEKNGYNREEKDEPSYVKEDEGVRKLRLDFYFTDKLKTIKFKKSFFLEEKDVAQKVKEDMSEEEKADFIPKFQWVNQVGESSWATDEASLPTRFTKFTRKNKATGETEVYGDKKFRIAKAGEADLLDFITKWQGNFDYRSVNTDILLDLKKLFNGNFRELQDGVNSEFATSTIELLTVKTVEGEDGPKEYQNVWSESLPGYTGKVLKNISFSAEKAEMWKNEKKTKDNPEGRYLKNYEQFAVDLYGQYGCKDYFEVVPLKEYDPSENLAVNDTNDAY